MARCGGCAPAILGLEGRGSRFVSSRLSRPLISARPPPRDEEMTPLGCARAVPYGGDAERHARVATRNRVCTALETSDVSLLSHLHPEPRVSRGVIPTTNRSA